jgi:hypothetical protein
MSNELKTQFNSGATVYAVVLNSAAQAWRGDTHVFETLAAGDWTQYASPMTEQASAGIYAGNFPAAITVAGTYCILFRQQTDVAPAATDLSNGMLGGTLYWNGSSELSPVSTTRSGGGSGGGTGPIAINQNTGGTDNLRYVDSSGNGVGDADVLIYLATDWPSQPTRVQASIKTGPDGRWLSPAFVQSGTYVAVFSKIGADGPDVSHPFTV